MTQASRVQNEFYYLNIASCLFSGIVAQLSPIPELPQKHYKVA